MVKVRKLLCFATENLTVKLEVKEQNDGILPNNDKNTEGLQHQGSRFDSSNTSIATMTVREQHELLQSGVYLASIRGGWALLSVVFSFFFFFALLFLNQAHDCLHLLLLLLCVWPCKLILFSLYFEGNRKESGTGINREPTV